MTKNEIIIKESGVTIFGFPVGFAPTVRDFDLAFEDSDIRHLAPLNGRQLRIDDSSGLSWLTDIEKEVVLWFDVRLASFRYRPHDDHDPADVFKGKIRIAEYTVQGPFSFETGEIIRKVTIPTISINLVADGKRIRAINIAFGANEKTLT